MLNRLKEKRLLKESIDPNERTKLEAEISELRSQLDEQDGCAAELSYLRVEGLGKWRLAVNLPTTVLLVALDQGRLSNGFR